MLHKWIVHIFDYIVNCIGYFPAIKLKDTLLYLSGFSLGCIVISFILGKSFYKIGKLDVNMDKMSVIKVKHGGSHFYYTNPANWAEAVETLFNLSYRVLSDGKGRDYTLKNKKRTQVFIISLIAIAGLLGIIGIILITNPIMRGELHPR